MRHSVRRKAAQAEQTPIHEEPVEGTQISGPEHARGASLLCEDESTRQRLLDMESHLASARLAVFVMITAGLAILAHWIGWWPLVAVATSLAGYWLAGRRMPTSTRPEYWFMGAWAFSQAAMGVAIAATGGPRSVFLPWLAIPAVTLNSRFKLRGVIMGVIWTVAVMVAVTVGISPDAVAERPQRLIVPLVLLGGVVVLSTALMRSDVKHRAEAIVDPLTGLFNRQALAVRAHELIEQARVSGMPLAVLIGDLDEFKRVNDRHGHHTGDAVLRETANTLRATLRTFDYIYRYGGEEFVILLPGTDEARALATAERVRDAIGASHPAGLRLTMSIGVTVACDGEKEFDDLLIAADRALYRAKAQGRDRVCLGRAQDGTGSEIPSASQAANAVEETGIWDAVRWQSREASSPAGAFELARKMFIEGDELDMQVLADRLHISLETVHEWCGDRESLLGEINASLGLELLRQAKSELSEERGTVRMLALYDRFVRAAARFRPLQLMLQRDQQLGLRVMTSRTGHVHPAMVGAVHELLLEEHKRGALATPEPELRNLAYAIVRMAEAFLYNDAMLATEPQIHRSARMVERLMA
ncbi:MAG TPA: QsdR family transcriptional regulator [Solirubrobacteraceae bacterium]|nr:QsdR family transcriptional regulator [Solirubrobacteraceae bacterium]